MNKNNVRIAVYLFALIFLIYDLLNNYQSAIDVIRMLAYGVVINLISESIVTINTKKKRKR